MDDPLDIQIPGLRLATDVREGGQAVVLRGTDGEGRELAIKVARPERWAKESLLREIAALERIHASDHESEHWLVELVSSGALPDGRPYMVLPWFPHSLLTWLTVEEPPMVARFDALVQACAAVARLHSSGALHEVTVHRDLKPGNFLVRQGEDLQVRLADLGGVKARTFRERTSNTVMFTPTYAPLEQRLPLERPLDSSVDVHALGVMVFQVLTGELPETALNRSGYRLPATAELQALEDSREALPPDKEARFQFLAKQPLSTFYDLDAAPDMLDSDINMLKNALNQGISADAASKVAEVLIPALERAIRADPDRRESSARELLGACIVGRAQAGAAPSTALDRLVAPVLGKGAARARTIKPGTKRKRKLIPLVLVSMAVGGVLALGALWWMWPRSVALGADEAAALGMDVQLAPARISVQYTGSQSAHIIYGGMRSRKSRMPPQPLRMGDNQLQVRSEAGTLLATLVLHAEHSDTGWAVTVIEPAGARKKPWRLGPDELLALQLDANQGLRRRKGIGG